MRRFRALLSTGTFVILTLAGWSLAAASDGLNTSGSDSRPESRSWSFQPKPYPQTEYFLITETGMQFNPEVIGWKDRAYGPNYMLFWDVGLMKNISRRVSLGGTFGFIQGNHSDQFWVSFKPRVRYWLSDAVPLDLSPGVYLYTNAGSYSVKPRFQVEASLMYHDWIGLTTSVIVTQTKYPVNVFDSPVQYVSYNKTEMYAGLRLGSYPGLIGGGTVAVAWVILNAIFPDD